MSETAGRDEIMAARTLMVQGTGSDVGKSVLTSAFCRIFAEDGYRVAPFKSQNMALNSYITRNGGEIGRAQAVQAEAAMVEVTVDMNPVLLKPNQDNNSQVIYRGKPYTNMAADEYYGSREQTLQVIEESLHNLLKQYEIVVIEGAGSPAEINLREQDMVNMKIAEMAAAPVILVANIDRGGVFASIVGTLELLTPAERECIKGIIINKFRGQPQRFQEGVDFIEKETGKPVVGVIPYFTDFKIPEEDSLDRNFFGDDELEIAIIYLPHISNFTDFSLLAAEPGTGIKYIENPEELEEPDLIIIPGSKNVIEDLQYLYRSGFVKRIKNLRKRDIPVVGICGGYQMMGEVIKDPLHLESKQEQIEGMGLLPVETILEAVKVTSRVKAEILTDSTFFAGLKGLTCSGYEIHQGRTRINDDLEQIFKIKREAEKQSAELDGVISKDGLLWGSYLHGVFDNDEFRRNLINFLRQRKGLSPLQANNLNARGKRDEAYTRLAQLVRDNIDIELVYDIMEEN